MKKKLLTRPILNSFIPKFNADHKFTKIVDLRTSLSPYGEDKGKTMCWVLNIKVTSYKDARKTLCHFRLNVWPEDTTEAVDQTINDMYRGLRDFLDCHNSIEEQVLTKKQPELAVAA